MTPSSWLDDFLPEVLWAALIVDRLDRDDALAAFRALAHAVDESAIALPDGQITHSALADDSVETVEAVSTLLCKDSAVGDALCPLRLLPDLPGYDAWSVAVGPLDSEMEGWARLASAVTSCFDHQSQSATDCRWIMVLARLVSGKLHLGVPDRDREILDYPHRGDMRAVRPFIRAAEMALRNMDGPTEWPEVFWHSCLDSTECGPFYGYLPSSTGLEVGMTAAQLERLQSQIQAAFWVTMEHTSVDAKRDGVFGLSAYSAAILAELMRPGASTSIAARSSLRTLTEIAITLAYLVKKDDSNVWQQFRNYGVGRAKLIYMKQEGEDSPSFVKTEVLEALANEDYWEEFTSIELGHWRGRDLRRLAEVTGMKDLYDKYYDWTSHHGHGHWGAIRESEFLICMNPLHRFHRVLAPQSLPLGDVMPDAVVVVNRVLDWVRKAYPSANIDPVGAPVDEQTCQRESE